MLLYGTRGDGWRAFSSAPEWFLPRHIINHETVVAGVKAETFDIGESCMNDVTCGGRHDVQHVV